MTGFAINDVSALEVNRISGSDVAFVTAGQNPEVVATTLQPPIARSLAEMLRSDSHAMGKAMRAGKAVPRAELELGGEPWFALQSPLMDAAGKPVGATVALASLRRRARRLPPDRDRADRRRPALGADRGRALLPAWRGGRCGRCDSSPPRPRPPGRGTTTSASTSDRTDEVGKLAFAFDELLADLREKRDMEAYVTELSRNLPEPAQARPWWAGRRAARCS